MEQYFLHVDVIVHDEKAGLFERLMAQFLQRGAFKFFNPEFDSELVLALKTPAPFSYSGYERFQSNRLSVTRDQRLPAEGKVFRYVNLWRIPDLADLNIARAMKSSADDTLYMNINSLVARELQNFVLRVQWIAGNPVPSNATKFVRVLRQFTSADLGTYLFKVGALFPLLAEQGWRTLGHYQNVTGPLNTVVEFWETKDGDERLQSMLTAFSKQNQAFQEKMVKPFVELPIAEVRELLIRAPYLQQG